MVKKMAIKLIIDSACDISKAEAEKLGVYFVPMEIQFGDEFYFDGVNITPDEFYEKLTTRKDFPKTSQITPYRFAQIYKEIVNNNDEAIVITISSKLSGTYLNALMALKDKEFYKDKIHIIDSMNACLGQRLLIQYALRLIEENKTVNEIVQLLNHKKKQIKVIAVLDTLKFLKKGGRIPSFVAFSGEILAIKPIIEVIDGEVKVVGKAHGFKNGKATVNKFAVKEGDVDLNMPYCVGYSGFSDEIAKTYLQEEGNPFLSKTNNVPIYVIGSTIGTHIGPGAVGISYFVKDKIE